ncbi:MAG TPA: TIGR03936 family radical SAM-associated protein [Acidimicrobiales bacterium]
MRIRFRFSKVGKVRFTSQRDVARMWERALRKARLPLAYTEGFSPRPQLSFGFALPTCAESIAEYLDVALDPGRPETASVDVYGLPSQLTPLLPEGITVSESAVVDPKSGSLQQQVTSCSWVMNFTDVTREALAERTAALLEASVVPIRRERKGREADDDLRPSVLALSVPERTDQDALVGWGLDRGNQPGVELIAELVTQPRGVRPRELVAGLVAVGRSPGWDGTRTGRTGVGQDEIGTLPVLDRACRTQQWIERDGARWEPLALRAIPSEPDRAVYASVRAS